MNDTDQGQLQESSSRPDPGSGPGPAWNPFAGASALYLRAWALYLVLALAAAVWMSLRGASVLQAVLGGERALGSWALDLGMGLGCGLAALVAWEGLRRLPWGAELEVRLRTLLSSVSRAEALALAALSGFAEELFFRGAMQPAAGLWLTAVVFGLAHLAPGKGGLLWAGWAATLGVVLGLLAQWTGALVAPMLAHATINAAGLWRMVGDGGGRESAAAADPDERRVE